MRIGVLALQGDFREHLKTLHALGRDATPVRSLEELEGVDALILPGGESTTIGFMLHEHDMIEPLRKRIDDGVPVYGTCAGAILLARDVAGGDVHKLGVLDAVVCRNAYGRQVDSFEADVDCGPIGTVTAVFIRAPVIETVGPSVEVLGSHDGRPVLVREGRILAGTFHPELTSDDRIHRYFLEDMCS